MPVSNLFDDFSNIKVLELIVNVPTTKYALEFKNMFFFASVIQLVFAVDGLSTICNFIGLMDINIKLVKGKYNLWEYLQTKKKSFASLAEIFYSSSSFVVTNKSLFEQTWNDKWFFLAN